MKILWTASSHKVGLAFHLIRPAISLKRRGHDVIVISGLKEEIEGLSNELNSEGVKHYRLKGLDDPVDPTSVWELGRILKAENSSVVHIFGLIKLAKFYSANLLLSRSKNPVVLHMDSIRDRSAIRKIGYVAFRRMLNSYVDAIIPVSDWTKRRLEGYGVREDRMFTVYNAIDVEWFDSVAAKRPPGLDFIDEIEGKVVVTQVSGLYPWKGHEYLLRAARRILTLNPSVHFLIVGGGPLRQKLEDLVHSSGISKNVTFAGQVRNHWVPWILSNVDIGVLASLRENCPRALLEYMAAQKPVVATRVGGVPEVIAEGVNGYIVPPGNPNRLASAILKLIDDSQEARKMGITNRGVVEEKFSLDTFTSRLESLYELAIRVA